MAIRRKQIRELVENLLAQHHVTEGAVPVERIVKSCGIDIKLDEVDDDLSGFLVRENKGKKRSLIGANKSHHPHRQRFTIAHELGHFLLHQGESVHLDEHRQGFTINMRNRESATGEDSDEREANLFAAELLMPAKFLQKDLSGQNLDLLEEEGVLLHKLARKYKVSTQALTFRLANLGYIKL
jgi:Zn-dependent peptidase ImmA (M78 family)